MNEIHETLKSGVTGLLASAGSLTVSLATDIEPWLRVASLLVGIAVGVASARSIWINTKRKN